MTGVQVTRSEIVSYFSYASDGSLQQARGAPRPGLSWCLGPLHTPRLRHVQSKMQQTHMHESRLHRKCHAQRQARNGMDTEQIQALLVLAFGMCVAAA